VQDKAQDLALLMKDRLEDLRTQLEQVQRDLRRVSPLNLVDQRRQQLDDTMERLQTQMQHLISLQRERLRGTSLQLHSLSPLLTIARGYAITRRDENQEVVTSIQQVQPEDALTIQVQDGHIPVRVRSS